MIEFAVIIWSKYLEHLCISERNLCISKQFQQILINLQICRIIKLLIFKPVLLKNIILNQLKLNFNINHK